MRKKWSEILEGVKEEKVRVDGWFMEGEGVCVLEEKVLVGLKNKMDGERREKEGKGEVIEGVVCAEVGG